MAGLMVYKIAMAFMLIFVPESEEAIAEDMIPLLNPAIRHLAISLEILDPRELMLQSKWSWDFRQDIRQIQTRQQILQDAPPLSEIQRIAPSRQYCQDMLKFNLDFRKSLEARLQLDVLQKDLIEVTLAENKQLYRIWDDLESLHYDYMIYWKRQTLQNIRRSIGDEAFYGGVLPPCVPIWRIPEAR